MYSQSLRLIPSVEVTANFGCQEARSNCYSHPGDVKHQQINADVDISALPQRADQAKGD